MLSCEKTLPSHKFPLENTKDLPYLLPTFNELKPPSAHLFGTEVVYDAHGRLVLRDLQELGGAAQ